MCVCIESFQEVIRRSFAVPMAALLGLHRRVGQGGATFSLRIEVSQIMSDFQQELAANELHNFVPLWDIWPLIILENCYNMLYIILYYMVVDLKVLVSSVYDDDPDHISENFFSSWRKYIFFWRKILNKFSLILS